MTEPTTQSLIERLTQTNQFHENADVTTAEVVAKLEAQAREIESFRVGLHNLREKNVKARAERDTLSAELASIRAVPVVDVNAGLVELPEIPVYPMPTPFYPQAHVYSREQMQDYARQAIATARTQQAPKGGE